MSDNARGWVKLEVGDDEVYYLRISFTALADADQELGTSAIGALQERDERGNPKPPRMDAIRALLKAAVSNKRNPTNAQRRICDALDEGKLDIGYCMGKLVEAMQASGIFKAADDETGETEAP